MIVAALQGESLDALVWRATGQQSGAVERVLEANRDVSKTALALPEGSPITIPDLPVTSDTIDIVQLWD